MSVLSRLRNPGALLALAFCLLTPSAWSQPFLPPTANRALFEPNGGARFFVGTVGKPWTSGAFGGVRSEGNQLHEGLDIRCLQRDKHGEPQDPVLASAAGTVAYVNRKAGLSNYGNYIILRHQIDGLEIYTLYAHLSQVKSGLQAGQTVRAGEPIAVMGRTSNTHQRITKDRAHVHYEIDLFVNDRFAAWFKKNAPGQRNDHGIWNGRNLTGLDPREILLLQQQMGAKFNLVNYIRSQPILCRVLVRSAKFPWAQRYRALIRPNPAAEQQGVAGYELALNYTGVICEMIPRSAAELNGVTKPRLVAVNENEAAKNRCGHLVARQGGSWRLTTKAVELLDLLTY
jgi:peptidoglycan LD-endopeptidase LytH